MMVSHDYMITSLQPYGTAFTAANGLEYVEARQLAARDVGEAIPQQLLDAAKLVLRQAQGPGDARRCRAAVPGDRDQPSLTKDPVQLVTVAARSGQIATLFTETTRSTLASGRPVRSAVPRSSCTRPVAMAFRLCRVAWSRISGDGSTPRMLAASVR